MHGSHYMYTIWTVTPHQDHFHFRVNAQGGPSGNACTVELGKERMQLLMKHFDVREERQLKGKTFRSLEETGSAAIYEFLLRILKVN